MKKLNNYFFDEDYINLSDALWFYGTFSVSTIISIVLFISTL